jgi:hypothetical protein
MSVYTCSNLVNLKAKLLHSLLAFLSEHVHISICPLSQILLGQLPVPLPTLSLQFTTKSRYSYKYPVQCVMNFLEFTDVSFLPYLILGKLCEDLNTTVGQDIWYDTFQVQNTKWLWLVNNIVTTMKSNNMLCGCLDYFQVM